MKTKEQGLEAAVEKTFEEMIALQQSLLLKIGRQIIPYLTVEDLLQPNDFAKLEFNPLFRYEEGVLAGLLAAQMAIRVSMKDEGALLDKFCRD